MALVFSLAIYALLRAFPAQSAPLPDVDVRYQEALQQRDGGEQVKAFFALTQLGYEAAGRAGADPDVHHQLAVIARTIASISFYFGKSWAADVDTGAWPLCLRFQWGYLYAAEAMAQCLEQRKPHGFPWEKLTGVASLLRSRLRGLGCEVPAGRRIWPDGYLLFNGRMISASPWRGEEGR